MSNERESVSALLPVRNGEQFLRELVPTILQMLNSSDEFIIVNDGSTDNSEKILEEFQKKDPRIKLKSTIGVGLVGALNLGLLEATNNWIARFDADDQYSDRRLVEQRKLIKDGVAVIFSDYRFVSKNSRNLGLVCSALTPIPMVLSLISSQRTAHPVALINRKLLEESGYYKSEDYPAEDLALWLRLSELGEIISAPAELLYYRLSPGSISDENRESQISRKNQVILSFKSWDQVQQQSLLQFEATVNYYKLMPKTADRVYLHIRDLYLASRVTGVRISASTIARKLSFLLFVKILLAASRITVLAIFRRAYRLSNKK